MKIMHICNDYYNSSLYKEYIKVCNKEFDNEVIVFKEKKYHSYLNENNVTVIKCLSKFDRFMYFYKQRKMFLALKDTIDIEKFDLVHAYFLFTNGYIAYKLGIPYIVTIQNTDINYFYKYRKYLKGIGLKILLKAKYITFFSNAYKDELLKKHIPLKYKNIIENKCVVINSGISSIWLKNINKKMYVPLKNNLRIVYTGRIDKNKNLLTTLNAIKHLEKKGYSVTYTVIGEMFSKSVYNKLRQERNVVFLNKKTAKELIEIYKNQDIFVMPSIYESFGLVYPEAMSQGLPVIYTKGQGFDQNFPDGHIGYAIPAKNEKKLAEAIEKIMQRYSYISNNCINECINFSWEKIQKEFAHLYY